MSVVVLAQEYAAVFLPIPVKMDPATRRKTAELIRLVSRLDDGNIDIQQILRRQKTELDIYYFHNYNIRENDTSAPIDVFTNFTLKLLEVNHEGTSGFPPTYVTSTDWGRRRLVTRGVKRSGDRYPRVKSSEVQSASISDVRRSGDRNHGFRSPVRDLGRKNIGVRYPWIRRSGIRTHMIRNPEVLESYVRQRKSAALATSALPNSEKEIVLWRRGAGDDGWKSILEPAGAELNEQHVEGVQSQGAGITPFKNEADLLEDENNKFLRHSNEQNDGDKENNKMFVDKADINNNRYGSESKDWKKPDMVVPNQVRAKYYDNDKSDQRVNSNSFLENVWDKTTKNWKDNNNADINKPKSNNNKRGKQRQWGNTDKHENDKKNKIQNWEERHSNVDTFKDELTKSVKQNNYDEPKKSNYNYDESNNWDGKLDDWNRPTTRAKTHNTKSPYTIQTDNDWDRSNNREAKSPYKIKEVDTWEEIRDKWSDPKQTKEKYYDYDKTKSKKKQNDYTDHRNQQLKMKDNNDWHLDRERQKVPSKAKKEEQRDTNWDRPSKNYWKKPTNDWERPRQYQGRPKKVYGPRDGGPYTRTQIPYIGKKGIYVEVED